MEGKNKEVSTETLKRDIKTVNQVETGLVDLSRDDLTPKNIVQKQDYIASERAKYAPSLSPDEQIFQAWERMVANYTQALKQSRTEQSKIPNSRIAVSPTEKEESKEQKQLDAQSTIKQAVDLPISDVNVFKKELVEWQAVITEQIQKYPELSDSLPGMLGSILILRLQAGGFNVKIDSSWKVHLDPQNQNAIEITTNLNQDPNTIKNIARGMLYQSTVMESYIRANTDENGNAKIAFSLNDPKTGLANYTNAYIGSTGNNASQSDKNLRDSIFGISKVLQGANMQAIFSGYTRASQEMWIFHAASPDIQKNIIKTMANSGVSNIPAIPAVQTVQNNISTQGTRLDKAAITINKSSGISENIGEWAGTVGKGIFDTGFGFIKWFAWDNPLLVVICSLAGIYFGWKALNSEWDIPGLWKVPWWKALMGIILGGGVGVAGYKYFSKPDTSDTARQTPEWAHNQQLAKAWLTEKYREYGWLIENQLKGANFQWLSKWAQWEDSTVPQSVLDAVKDEKDETKKEEMIKFIKEYISKMYFDPTTPGLKETVALITSSAGGDKMTLSDVYTQVYSKLAERVKVTENGLKQVMNDPKSTPEQKKSAKEDLDTMQNDKASNAPMFIWGIFGIGGLWAMKAYLVYRSKAKIAQAAVNMAHDALNKSSHGSGVAEKWAVAPEVKPKEAPKGTSHTTKEAPKESKKSWGFFWRVKSISTGRSLAKTTGFEGKLTAVETSLNSSDLWLTPEQSAKLKTDFSELKAIARDIDQTSGPTAKVFSNARRVTDLNTRLLETLSVLDDTAVTAMMNHADAQVKNMWEALRDMKRGLNSVKSAEYLREFLKLAK